MIPIIILLTEYVCFVFCRLGGRVVLGDTIIILLTEYVCFVFCRLGGRVVLGDHYHHIVNGVCLFCIL